MRTLPLRIRQTSFVAEEVCRMRASVSRVLSAATFCPVLRRSHPCRAQQTGPFRRRFGRRARQPVPVPHFPFPSAQERHVINIHKYFTSVLDTISDGVFISDAAGTTLYVNRMYAELSGMSETELRGKNVRELVDEGVFDRALNPEVVRTGKPATYMQKLKDGKNVVISGVPVFDEKGNVCLVVTYVRDETRLAQLNEQTGEQRRQIKEINDKLAFVAKSQGRDLEPAFTSHAMQEVAAELQRYAVTDATVLIMGETGVGKDVFARMTHRWSRRKDKILLKVDCGGISETLTESEIFGYAPGAFTGASSKGKPGYFEIADGSTIFLDEIGELPLSMQTRLLRVLQDNEIVRVGSSQPRKVDVRIIAATNRNLEECVEAGTFRRDLFYRLNVGTVRIPPLRERPEDVRVLAEYFLRQFTAKYRKKMTFMDITLDMMARYSWPGNARELQNMVHSLVITRQGPMLSPRDLPSTISGLRDEQGEPLDAVLMRARPLKNIMSDMEREFLRRAIEVHGSIRKVAEMFQVNRSTIFRKLHGENDKTREGKES